MQINNINSQIETWAIKAVMNHERKNGRKVVDVSKNKNFRGIDLISMKKDESEVRTIEVKGTTRIGVINFSETELLPNKTLVASHLYIVLFPNEPKKKSKGRIIEIAKRELKSENFREQKRYTLSSEFINDKIKNVSGHTLFDK